MKTCIKKKFGKMRIINSEAKNITNSLTKVSRVGTLCVPHIKVGHLHIVKFLLDATTSRVR